MSTDQFRDVWYKSITDVFVEYDIESWHFWNWCDTIPN